MIAPKNDQQRKPKTLWEPSALKTGDLYLEDTYVKLTQQDSQVLLDNVATQAAPTDRLREAIRRMHQNDALVA